MELGGNVVMDLSLPLLLSTVVCYVFFFVTGKAARSRRPLPPGPRGWPVLGNLPQLGGKTHQTLHEMTKAYGPLLRFRFGSANVVVAGSAAVAEQFLRVHDANFSCRPPNSGGEHMAYNYQDVVFAPYGARWRAMRKAIMPILGWRWLFALSSLPWFVLLIFTGLLPESPRYLCLRGKTSEAMLVLDRIVRMNNGSLPPGILSFNATRRAGNNLDASVTTPLIMPYDSIQLHKETSSKSNGFNEFLALWSRDLIISTLLLLLVYTASNFAYYGMVVLTSELSNNSRSCASVGAHLMQPKDSSLYTNVLVTNFAEFPGLLLAGLLVDRVGRKVSLGGLILLCCAFLAPLAIHLDERLAITLLFCARACSAGSFAVLHAYSPEIYPTSCRNTGVGVAYSVGRFGSMVAPLATTALLENCRQKEAVLLMNLVLFLTGAACALFPFETKGREIQ